MSGFPCSALPFQLKTDTLIPREQAERLPFSIQKTPADGSCFYHALAAGLHRRAPTHEEATRVRLRIADELCDGNRLRDSHLDPFRWATATETEEQYCAGLRTTRGRDRVTYADNIVLAEAANLFAVNIVVLSKAAKNSFLSTLVISPREHSDRCVFVLLTQDEDGTGDGAHYDALLLLQPSSEVAAASAPRARAAPPPRHEQLLMGEPRRRGHGRLVLRGSGAVHRPARGATWRTPALPDLYYFVALRKLCPMLNRAPAFGRDVRVAIKGDDYEALRATIT